MVLVCRFLMSSVVSLCVVICVLGSRFVKMIVLFFVICGLYGMWMMLCVWVVKCVWSLFRCISGVLGVDWLSMMIVLCVCFV